MTRIEKLGRVAITAFELAVPGKIIVTILSISHRGRLKRLFFIFARRFLDAYAEATRSPNSRYAKRRMVKAKAVLDLVRCRLEVVGGARPSDRHVVAWTDEADLPRIVIARKAA